MNGDKRREEREMLSPDTESTPSLLTTPTMPFTPELPYMEKAVLCLNS